METAGSVVIQITGNTSAFEAALARAKEQATAFDAQITAQLNGAGLAAGLDRIAAGVDATNVLLAKLTTSGTAASAALSSVATSTATTTAALGEVAAATKAVNVELASLGGSGGAAVLESGAISAKSFAAALEATGGRLDKITPQMLGLATGTEALAAANVRTAATTSEMAAGMESVATTSRAAAAGMTALGAAETEAAGLGAGVTREISVLGAEIARGNISRLPGSLIVLNERLVSTGTGVLTLANGMKALGGLASVIFDPFVLGFLALSFGIDFAVKGFEKLGVGSSDLTKNLKDQADELSTLGKSYKDVAAAANSFSVDGLNSFGLSSTATIHGLQLDIANKTKDFTSTVGYLGGFDSSNQFQIYDDFKPFEDAINHLRETAAAGAPDILGFKKMIEDRWALDPNNEALTKSASELEDLVKDALSASVALQKLKQAQDDMPSHVGEGDAVVANMISAGNAAADALKAANENFGTSGLTSYENAVAGINQKFDDMIVKAHAVGAAFDTFNQARDLSLQEASLKALSSISFDKPIAGANAFGLALAGVGKGADGVKVELGGMAEPIVNITQLFAKAKLDQLIGIESATNELQGFKTQLSDVQDQLDQISKTSPSLLFGAGDKGTQADITSAYNQIDDIFKRYDSGSMSVKAVHDAIEQVRASLLAMGGDVSSVNQFINAIVQGEEKVRQLNGNVLQLGSSIAHLPDKTVTITIKTVQVGSGSMSSYDVPNSSGGTSGVNVYRYGNSDQQPSYSQVSVPSTYGGSESSGYGSSYGISGDTTVGVTRFASEGPWQNYNGATPDEWAKLTPQNKQDIYDGKTDYAHILYPDYYRASGGPVLPGMPYVVGEQGPEIVIPSGAGTVVPNGQSTMFAQALASAQNGFTGTQPTQDSDRLWTVFMNIEAATQKTADLLDQIKTASANSSSSLGGSSSSGSSSSSSTDQSAWQSAFSSAYKTAQSNYYAARASFGGDGGVLFPELAASPFDIAMNAASMATGRGGVASVGSAGATSYEKDMATQSAAMQKMYGFDSGGFIAPGDTQEVHLFKSPEETLAVFTPSQMKAMQGANQNQQTTTTADQRPINIYQTRNWNGNAPPSQASQNELRRQTALAVRDAMRAYSGR